MLQIRSHHGSGGRKNWTGSCLPSQNKWEMRGSNLRDYAFDKLQRGFVALQTSLAHENHTGGGETTPHCTSAGVFRFFENKTRTVEMMTPISTFSPQGSSG